MRTIVIIIVQCELQIRVKMAKVANKGISKLPLQGNLKTFGVKTYGES